MELPNPSGRMPRACARSRYVLGATRNRTGTGSLHASHFRKHSLATQNLQATDHRGAATESRRLQSL